MDIILIATSSLNMPLVFTEPVRIVHRNWQLEILEDFQLLVETSTKYATWPFGSNSFQLIFV